MSKVKGGGTTTGGKGGPAQGGVAAARLSKKKKEFELAKDKILSHLDLTSPVVAGGGKLLKNLDQCRAAKERLAGSVIKQALKKQGGNN